MPTMPDPDSIQAGRPVAETGPGESGRAVPLKMPIRTPLMMAADQAPTIRFSNQIETLDLPCKKILNRCTSEVMPFRWTINPYRGCEFACRYCYARYTHEYMGLEDPRLFETRIFAKSNAAEALEEELSSGKSYAGGIAIGTVTDPYQPAERSLRLTRKLLEVFSRHEGLDISITTKSDLIARDIDLLREVARRNRLGVHVTITTFNRRLARMLEPRAPRPAKRIEAVRQLAGAGIETTVFIMPVLPGITDRRPALEAIVGAAARAGAINVGHQTLFLRTSAKKVFYEFLKKNFPEQAPLYRRSYGQSVYYSTEYRARLRELIESLKRRHGLAVRGKAGAPARHSDGARQPEAASGRSFSLSLQRPRGRAGSAAKGKRVAGKTWRSLATAQLALGF